MSWWMWCCHIDHALLESSSRYIVSQNSSINFSEAAMMS